MNQPYYPYDPFGYGPPVVPPQPPPPESNTLATLSVVFAFVFAPVGAVLGHLALSESRHRGGGGGDRALVGLTLSYVFIVLAVVVTLVWTTFGNGLGSSSTVATPATTETTAPGTTKPAPPPEPFVRAVDLPQLLLSADEVSEMVKAPGLVTAATGTDPGNATNTETGGPLDEATGNPRECITAVFSGQGPSYSDSGYRGFYLMDQHGPGAMVTEVVAAFDNSAAARGFLSKSVEQWRQCAGRVFTATGTGAQSNVSIPFTVGEAIERNGMFAVRDRVAQSRGQTVRVMSSKANVVVDLSVTKGQPSDEAEAMAVAARILDRIPT